MSAIISPALLVDKQKTMANIERMRSKAVTNNLVLKPHFKTHQSLQIGEWFKERDIEKITVSSVSMAEYFARGGWDDITIAFPCNVLEADRINRLAQSVRLSILISDKDTASILQNAFNHPIQVYIEIDTGSDRTGFKPDDIKGISKAVHTLSESTALTFRGFYSHPGHSYSAQSKQEIKSVHQDAVKKMKTLKAHFVDDFPNVTCCLGDTPCSSAGDDWKGVDEMSPGNFVFYDVMQTRIGSCTVDDIAVALACPVVATYPHRQEIVVHGGAVHLSKDSVVENSATSFGKIVRFNDEWCWNKHEPGCYVKSLSQEHGIVHCSASFFKSMAVGDVIGVLPVHSCLTADVMQGYICTDHHTNIDHLKGNLSS